MKKYLVAFIVAILSVFLVSDSPAHSTELHKRVAVIDTGLDMTHPVLNGKVAYEVCIMSFALCPNGQKFMEGTGSATIDPTKITNSIFYHGTQMSSIIIQNNPNAEIIFIRIVAMNANGSAASTSLNTLGSALDWVNTNSQKYNIGAVSVSMGQLNPTCITNSVIEKNILALKQKEIPAIFANGNNYNYNNINFPACFSPSIAVGGADYISNKYYPSLYSNNSSATDFYALGKLQVAMPNGKYGTLTGTSSATALIASKWAYLSDKGLSYQQVYDKLKANSIVVSTKNITNALIVMHDSLG